MTRSVRCLALAAVLAAGLLQGSPTDAQAPPEAGSSDWRQITTGDSHSCGIRMTGRLFCWGADNIDQLGDGGPSADQDHPVEVFGGGTNWSRVSAGSVHTCGLKTNGRLFCWGYDAAGQVGDGPPNVTQAIPTEVAGGHTDWTSVSAGGGTTCGRRSSGRLYCWGQDGDGQLGNGGGPVDESSPVEVAGGHTTWAQVSVGGGHTCGRRTNGRLYCWGFDFNGQLGDGGPGQDRQAPVQVAGGHTDWRSVSAGNKTTCGLRAGGRLYCWGSDEYGRLGNGPATGDRGAPVAVGGTARWRTVVVGESVCATRTDGRLYCWGPDSDGQLGNGGPNSRRQVPTLVAGGGTNWAEATPGYRHTCGRRLSGRAFCWGGDFAGQLGDGAPLAEQTTPVRVL